MMSDVIVVEDSIDVQGVRHVYLMSNAEIGEADLQPYLQTSATTAKIEAGQNVGAFYVKATWPCRGVVDVHCEGWPRFKRMVLWALMPGDRMSIEIVMAAHCFLQSFGGPPQFAFARKLPNGVADGMPLVFENYEVILLQAEWVPERCVAVGGRG